MWEESERQEGVQERICVRCVALRCGRVRLREWGMRESMSRLLVYGNGTDHPLRDCDHKHNSDLSVPDRTQQQIGRRDIRLKFDALAIAWEQVPGQLVPLYAGPAQSPQSVMSKMRLCARKWDEMSHCVFGKSASGVPQVDGSGCWLVMSAGMLSRSKNQTEIASDSTVCAHTPPACMLKRCPNVLFPFCCHAHPALLPFEDSHVVPRRFDSASAALSSRQPGPLWSVIWFCEFKFTPSASP